MSYLPDFDTPFELRREQRPVPGARATAPRLRRRPVDWQPGGVAVYARDGEPAEKLIRRFANVVMRESVLSDARRHAHAVRPGEQRRLKRARAAARRRKAQR